jgi:transcription elongation factor Elf1
MKKNESFKLSLKDNNLVKIVNCGICRTEFEPDMGVSMFLANSYDNVCDKCAKKFAKDLFKLLEVDRIFQIHKKNEHTDFAFTD